MLALDQIVYDIAFNDKDFFHQWLEKNKRDLEIYSWDELYEHYNPREHGSRLSKDEAFQEYLDEEWYEYDGYYYEWDSIDIRVKNLEKSYNEYKMKESKTNSRRNKLEKYLGY